MEATSSFLVLLSEFRSVFTRSTYVTCLALMNGWAWSDCRRFVTDFDLVQRLDILLNQILHENTLVVTKNHRRHPLKANTSAPTTQMNNHDGMQTPIPRAARVACPTASRYSAINGFGWLDKPPGPPAGECS
jgi:hypothetical protein